jgi:fermentation-respiration switch protein FrsA (DUF1100 family)
MASIIAGRWATSMTWRFVSRVHYDTIASVRLLDVPASVTHGGRDRVIPSRMGEAVFAAAKVKGRWLYVPSAAHGDLPLRAGDAYWAWITEGLKPVMNR